MISFCPFVWLEQLGGSLRFRPPARRLARLLFLYFRFVLYDFLEMASGKDKMEPRLMSIIASEGVATATMDKLGDSGVTSLSVFTCLASSREKFVEFIEKAPLNVVSGTVMETIEQAKLIAAWEAARVSRTIDVEAAAQRRSQRLPQQIEDSDHDAAVKIFETAEHELSKYTTPSKAFFERLQAQVEARFELVDFTTVTNLDSREPSSTTARPLELVSGGLRETLAKPFLIPLPRNDSQLRARIRLLAVGYLFVKSRNPSKLQLSTASLKMFDNYTEFLFGPSVWAQASLNEHGEPTACPHIGHVLAYDRAIRTKVAELMNSGSDIESAFLEARKDKEIKTVSFHNAVAIAIQSKACTDLSAPSFQDRASRVAKPEKPPNGPARPTTTTQTPGVKTKAEKAKAKRLRKKAKDAELKAAARAPPPTPHPEARPPKALMNGGIGDGRPAKKPKGAGKLKDKTDAGESICFNWNRGVPCSSTPCLHKHVCRICESPDHTAASKACKA